MHTYQNAGSYLVTLSISDTLGCQNVAGHTVTIHPAPQSSFSYEQVCAGSATVFTDLSLAPAGDTITAWYWDFGLAGSTDTSTQQHPQYTYLSGGTYTVTLTTTTEHGCSHSKSLPLQVWNTPTAYFSYTASPCANGAVQMHDSSWSYQATVQSWLWEFEPYQYGTGQNPSHVYYAIDSCYDVRLIVTDIRGCVDTTVQQVCVPPQLTVAYTYQQACFGDQTLFTPQLLTPAAPADSLITFSWNFGDTQSGAQNNSTLKTPGHRFTAPGFYTVSLTTTDLYGCQASDYQSVQVYALPVAAFGSAPGSCDSTVTFTSLSADTSAAIQLMYWDFGDGSLDTISAPLTTVTHKYTTAGTYTVTLTVENDNGCRSVVSDTVRRSPCLVAAYLSSDSLHCQNYALQFTDLSTCDGQISTWRWDWGDSTVTTVYTAYQGVTTHTYTQAGTYSVKLWVSTQVGGSTVSDSVTRQVTVLPSPLAGFSTQDYATGSRCCSATPPCPTGPRCCATAGTSLTRRQPPTPPWCATPNGPTRPRGATPRSWWLPTSGDAWIRPRPR
jgi:PKD repeat protein